MRRGQIIRPLLRFRKAELQHYAQRLHISFREDETNRTDLYARNRIRRALIPVMEGIRPNAPESILALARYAARTERAWRVILRELNANVFLSASAETIELAREKLLEYDAEIRARLLRSALRRLGVVPSRAATGAMLRFIAEGMSGGGFDVARGFRIERAYDVIRITRVRVGDADRSISIPDCGSGRDVARVGGRTWCVRWATSPLTNDGARFDCQLAKFPLTVRAWLPGDRMRLPYGSKKLKKLFAERRIPIHERMCLPILVDRDNHVLWVPGVARSADALPRDKMDALTITVSNAEIS